MDLISNSTYAFPSSSPLEIAVHAGSFFEVSSTSIWTVSAVAVVSLFAWLRTPWNDGQGHSIPKGPRGLPIIGSFYALTRFPELTLDFWAKKFGKLYSIWLGNQLFVIVSDPNVAKDLMVTNGNVFSSRKEMYIKSQTVFAGRGITATPYNDRWRKHRRIAATWLSQRAVDSYSPTLDRESLSLVKALFEESKGGLVPVNPQVCQITPSQIPVLTLAAPRRSLLPEQHDYHHFWLPYRQYRPPSCRSGFEAQSNCTGPMSNLVDFVSLLQYIPTPMHQRGKKLHNGLVDTYGGIIKDIERKMNSGGQVTDCLAKTMVEVRKKENLDDLDMAILASAFMIGGVETTAAIMQWFSALIPAYPEIQKKAQEELDRVVGRDRLPDVEDEKNLPYCHAIIKEVERVHNPFWLGTPHVATEDFVYEDQYIPKDTVVVLNTWTMHNDSTRHSNPEKFNPDRYINDPLTSADSANVANPMERDHWMFGAGRRICPGMLVAEREIWLTISRMLWAFDMYEIPGEPIDLKEYDGLSGRSPVPFRIGLKPRHEKVAKLLEEVEI
ncbi:unnamed protein product [Penicillium salamii]|uniref:Cytochrome P450 n=1 Tax=Penicillium salamii TaxID=1612424 RepID=A0A9W4JVU4_9EURO|nr:unnamed protein product [Penicillium salamii]